VWPWFFVAHGAITVPAIAVHLVMMTATGPEDRVNFGVIVVLLALLGMGLPWSVRGITMDQDRYESMSTAVFEAVHFGPAVADVVQPGLVLVASRRRSGS
jgi:hypothetical protein